MYKNIEDASLPALLVSMDISPEEFEEMRKESDSDPETMEILARSARFENGTETAEDLAWLEEEKKQSPSYLGMVIDHQSPLHPMYEDLKRRGFIDPDPDSD